MGPPVSKISEDLAQPAKAKVRIQPKAFYPGLTSVGNSRPRYTKVRTKKKNVLELLRECVTGITEHSSKTKGQCRK